ncbi:MAG TPA: hypothetical protein VHF47_10730 [Acidimicrobiales bacterium]|nr:hypothetical protein [Acidimicrobiales bacterium]
MDLSKVLGDVYESDRRQAPDWADEHRLDEVFAQWTPGPPAEAPAAEREIVADVRPPARLDDDFAVALTQALVADGAPSADPVPAFPEVEPEPDSVAAVLYAELATVEEPAPAAPAAPGRWLRGDDDIAFGGGGRRRARRR